MSTPMSEVDQAASGAIHAQEVIAAVRAEQIDVNVAWLRFVELMAKHGRHSQACRSYVLELTKRASR